MQYINPKKEKLIIEIHMSPLKDLSHSLQGFILLFQDLTEVKRLEYAMRQQEKLAAVGQLAAGIAHEIRNPLASISGSIQLLNTSSEQSEDNKKLMNIVIREIDRLNNLISEFLEYVRPSQALEDEIQLDSLLNEVVELASMNPQLNTQVKVISDYKINSKIMGQRNKLKQAFLNIIINAYQAMENQDQAVLHIETGELPTHVWVKIRDTGVGIPKETVPHIFEPFHTTKAKGTGLGLAITHKVFENHNAQVEVESEPNMGTQFKMIFPKV